MSVEQDRFQRKLEALEGQMNLVQSALKSLREEMSNVAAAGWAAIDAEARAGVVAEEPEWEYGIRDEGANEPFTDHYDSIDAMSEEFDGFLAQKGEEVARRRKAGPWVPVEQGEGS